MGFMESHDVERVAYKALTYGNGAIAKNLSVRMSQLAVNAAFCFTVPGPKMIWQFGELGYDVTREQKTIKWKRNLYIGNIIRNRKEKVYMMCMQGY